MDDDAKKRILSEGWATVNRLADLQPPDPLDSDHEDAFTRWERQKPRPEPKPAKQRPAATTQAAADWSGWESWLKARLDVRLAAERAPIVEAVGTALGKERQSHRRELADEVRSLRLELTEANEVIRELRRVIAASSPAAEIIDLPARRAN